MRLKLVFVLILLSGSVVAARGQDPSGAAPDSSNPAPPPAPARASWLTDSVDLAPGAVLTVIIDEQTTARERVTEVGSNRRSLRAQVSAEADGESALGSSGLDSQWDNDSREIGEANRQGDLIGVLSVRVTSVTVNGIAEIEGRKTTTVDGREQTMTLTGFVRPEDVTSTNTVYSSQIANLAIEYQGKKIGPKLGILGKIISILWP